MNPRHLAERAWEKHYKKQKQTIESLVGDSPELFSMTKIMFKFHWLCDKYKKDVEDLRFRLKHAKKLLGY